MTAIIEDDETGSERTCIVTRKRSSPETMLRFVRSPDGAVVPDLKRKLPGRGVWLTPNRSIVEAAVKKKAFARAFKTEVKPSADLAELVDGLLERSARESFSLANKAGQIVAGFGKVEEALGHGGVLAILHASDAAPDGIRKVGQLVRRAQESGSKEIKVIAAMSSDDLGLALGRSHVIHAALLSGSASLACLQKLEFLRAYRTDENAVQSSDEQVNQPK
jgi:predicted RNA-binding protein YlxR (DUF448 family)